MKLLRIIILSMIVLIPATSLGQYKPIVFGLRVAPNIAWMKTGSEGYSSEGILPGFSWGLVADFFFMENYAVETGFNFSWLNGGLSFPSAMDIGNDTVPAVGTLKREYRLRYIEIPFLLRMQAELSEKTRIFGKVGLGAGFRISAKARDEFISEGNGYSSEKDIIDETKLVKSSLILGGGVIYVINGSTGITLDVTYNDGFTNVLNGNNVVDPSVKNNATLRFVELSIGILF